MEIYVYTLQIHKIAIAWLCLPVELHDIWTEFCNCCDLQTLWMLQMETMAYYIELLACLSCSSESHMLFNGNIQNTFLKKSYAISLTLKTKHQNRMEICRKIQGAKAATYRSDGGASQQYQSHCWNHQNHNCYLHFQQAVLTHLKHFFGALPQPRSSVPVTPKMFSKRSGKNKERKK